jgi:hypothetical protein
MRKAVELMISHDKLAPGSKVDELRLRGRLLQAVTKARQALAAAKVASTVDFVRGAVEQGEKVIVFSCFDEPMQRLSRELGDAAVVLTGKTPADRRQALVDRFEHDPKIRIFLANIVAGGVGTNLTAATQVVFNDLDWVPANHWQAEDRAYRIGQTRSVNVTYMVARDSIDDFVQSVLQKKAALVNAIVDGSALAPGVSGDVLDELQRALRELSSGLTDGDQRLDEEDLIAQLLRLQRLELASQPAAVPGRPPRTPEETAALVRALESLASVLAGRAPERYRFASTSHPGVEYEVTIDGADVACSCPGFEYRGQCRHARDVKTALATGKPMPAGYRGA